MSDGFLETQQPGLVPNSENSTEVNQMNLDSVKQWVNAKVFSTVVSSDNGAKLSSIRYNNPIAEALNLPLGKIEVPVVLVGDGSREVPYLIAHAPNLVNANTALIQYAKKISEEKGIVYYFHYVRALDSFPHLTLNSCENGIKNPEKITFTMSGEA